MDKEVQLSSSPPVMPMKRAHMNVHRFPSKNNLHLDALIKKKEGKEVKKEENTLLWDLMENYIPSDVPTIQRKIVDHVEYTLARDRSNFDKFGAYQATAYSTRDRLLEYWNDTRFRFMEINPKRIYYLSIEFLLGRTLQNALMNLGVNDNYHSALKQLGYMLEEMYEQEQDAGLGNGGLGRLAACYLDSMATENYACWGYGLRYTYGMFKQDIFQGFQVETPDTWLKYGNPWEIVRYDVRFPVRFYGEARNGAWTGGETVIALAHDTPIPGFRTPNTINLRLWASTPSTEFDLGSFNDGNYYKAVERKQHAESISSVLYPSDNTIEGKELRLKQQYFFASATMQDIVRRFKLYNKDFSIFHEKVGVQLNDTHPTISVPELIRLLVDQEGLSMDQACNIAKKVFSYTNHTVLPEALEKWTIQLMERVVPRILQIIFDINHRFLDEARVVFPYQDELVGKLSIVEESSPKMIRMAHLAIIMSHKVNGVAEIHSNILKDHLFKEFVEMYPEKFINITNGITQRRWLNQCNPGLTKLITKTLGHDRFLTDLDQLAKLRRYADDPKLQMDWMATKQLRKKKLAEWIFSHMNIVIDPNALFDIQIKRIHEYKRQLLNILRVIHEYMEIRRKVEVNSDLIKSYSPRVVIFGGKAAPGYARAKQIIKLINSVAERVNLDKSIEGLLKVVFVPNYNVSLAELIIPASDISEHISTAGMEASGTSNMKFTLNGGIIIGTLDGANIEIRDAIGPENMFIFGLTADKVEAARANNQNEKLIKDPRLQEAVEAINAGMFGDPTYFKDITASLDPAKDYYLLGEDFASYLEAHQRVNNAFKDKTKWAKMSIMSSAGMGKFSSDRSVREYAEKVWGISPISYPDSPLVAVKRDS